MNSVIEEAVERLGITEKGSYFNIPDKNKDIYVINLKNSDAFARTYTKLENADWLLPQEGDLSLQTNVSQLLYLGDEVAFTLKGDLVNDAYTLEVEEI